jgi:hypothetical protein
MLASLFLLGDVPQLGKIPGGDVLTRIPAATCPHMQIAPAFIRKIPRCRVLELTWRRDGGLSLRNMTYVGNTRSWSPAGQ